MYQPSNCNRTVSGTHTLCFVAWMTVFLLTFGTSALAESSVSGTITNVTVYRGQALVTGSNKMMRCSVLMSFFLIPP